MPDQAVGRMEREARHSRLGKTRADRRPDGQDDDGCAQPSCGSTRLTPRVSAGGHHRHQISPRRAVRNRYRLPVSSAQASRADVGNTIEDLSERV